MSPARPIRRFLGGFVLAIAVLLAPWPGREEAYAKALRATGEFLFHNFGAKGLVRFRPNDEPRATRHDTKIFLAHRDQVRRDGSTNAVFVQFHAHQTGYVPTALVVALVLATPIPWRRRLGALLWGLLWVHGFIVFVLGLMILHQFALSAALGLYQWTGLGGKVLRAIYEVFVGYGGIYFAMPVLIWIAVAFRRDDWEKLLGPKPPPG